MIQIVRALNMAPEPYAVRLVAERGMRAPISEYWLCRKKAFLFGKRWQHLEGKFEELQIRIKARYSSREIVYLEASGQA
jgi:hypothetical protein